MNEMEFVYLNHNIVIQKKDDKFKFKINDLEYHFIFKTIEEAIHMSEHCVRVNLGLDV